MAETFEPTQEQPTETPQAAPTASEPSGKYYNVTLPLSHPLPFQRGGLRWIAGETKLLFEHELEALKIQTDAGLVIDPIFQITEVKS